VAEVRTASLYRFLGVADALADGGVGSASTAAYALDRVTALVSEALDALGEERQAELRGLLPDNVEHRGWSWQDVHPCLAVLRGYLRGCIDELVIESQREANARAYAEAKVREERGVGFGPRRPVLRASGR
jgi:hypothetical protein